LRDVRQGGRHGVPSLRIRAMGWIGIPATLRSEALGASYWRDRPQTDALRRHGRSASAGRAHSVDPGRYEGSFWDCGAKISGSRRPPGLTTGGADGAASAVEIGQPTGIGGRSSSIRFCARSSRMKTTTNATRTTTPTDTRTPYATAPGMTIFHYPTAPISPGPRYRGRPGRPLAATTRKISIRSTPGPASPGRGRQRLRRG